MEGHAVYAPPPQPVQRQIVPMRLTLAAVAPLRLA